MTLVACPQATHANNHFGNVENAKCNAISAPSAVGPVYGSREQPCRDRNRICSLSTSLSLRQSLSCSLCSYSSALKNILISMSYLTSSEVWADIPQVACRLTSRSPDVARWASVFRPERCLSSRKRPKSGGSGDAFLLRSIIGAAPSCLHPESRATG